MRSLSFSIQLIAYPTDSLIRWDNAKLLKVSLDVICDRLTYLVNESLKSGVFPKILEAVKVVPIF